MSETKRAFKAAVTIGSFTILSRFLGLFRDIVIAHFFGARIFADAFFAAFRIPNLLRRLFAEGALSISFIPVFTDYLENKGRDEAFRMARSGVRLLSLILFCLTCLGMIFSHELADVLAYGFEDPQAIRLVGTLTRIMMPYIFFISLVALAMGILNTMGYFAGPAMAPIFLNLCMIGVLVFVSWFDDSEIARINALAFGVLLGGIVQLAIQIPFLLRAGFRFWQHGPIVHPGLRRIGRLMLPSVFGAAAYQINIFVGIVLASTLAEGSITYLYYADRLVQFPLGIFAMSAATAILPGLSRQAVSHRMAEIEYTVTTAVRQVLFVTLPASFGLILMGRPIVACLFQRGAFDGQATQMTADALTYYALGLCAFSLIRIFVSVFNAFGDTRTPAWTAFASICVNVGLSLWLMGPLGHGGLALSTSLAACFHVVMLLWAFQRKIGSVHWKGVGGAFIRSLAASLAMGGWLSIMKIHFIPEKMIPTAGHFMILVVCMASGVFVFCIMGVLLRNRELGQFWRALKKKGIDH